jgi:thiamine biosynthesis lipoprotein
LLGTYVEIQIHADEDDDALLNRSMAAFDEIERIQRLMSFHDPESELTRINQNAHYEVVEISVSLWQIFAFSRDLHLASGGFFDPTIAPGLVRRGLLPDHGNRVNLISNWEAIDLTENSIHFTVPLKIDLGGIAKGYAVDCALRIIGDDVEATVNAGGDLAMNRWQGRHVAIRTPDSGGRKTISIPMENRSLATSGTYFLEGSHVILDPQDWLPFAGRQSVSVFAESCMVADAMTKVTLLMPDPVPLLRKYDATAFLMSLDGVVKRL